MFLSAGWLRVETILCSFVVRCTVASVAFSPTGLTFKISQLCMNAKQYPLPSGPNVTYFIFKGCRAQSDPLCNYDLLKMIPNYQWICGLVSGSKLLHCITDRIASHGWTACQQRSLFLDHWTLQTLERKITNTIGFVHFYIMWQAAPMES